MTKLPHRRARNVRIVDPELSNLVGRSPLPAEIATPLAETFLIHRDQVRALGSAEQLTDRGQKMLGSSTRLMLRLAAQLRLTIASEEVSDD